MGRFVRHGGQRRRYAAIDCDHCSSPAKLAHAMSGAAIGIVCKAPQAGLSKTRLAKTVGAVAASELSACFLRDVAAAIEAVPETVGRKGYVVYAPAGTEQVLRELFPE